jgi:putative flippase GtrA
MRTFLKANVASVIATGSDYGLTVLMKEVAGVDKLIAGVCGTVIGGIINFFICRHWVFNAGKGQVYFQGKRYFLTWAGNFLLNATGYYLLIHCTGINYILAKLITSLTVALAYNYPLQKKYVFKNSQ